MSKNRKSFLLRLNPELYRKIEGWAQQEFRSVNSQIEYILRQAVQQRYNQDIKQESDEDPASEEKGN